MIPEAGWGSARPALGRGRYHATMRPTPGADVDSLRGRVDVTLDGYLAEQRIALSALGPGATDAIDELARVIGAGGKRLRPLFCYWGHRAAGGADDDAIVRAAASLELLHTFAIIHDDVMDRSPVRRGQPATHVQMAGGDPHLGVSAAILAGDLALTLADQLFATAGFDAGILLEGFHWYNRMRIEVVTGQYLDLVAARSATIDTQTARLIASLKSGGYTVEKPLLIGAALARAGELLEVLSAYGRLLGEAFQLRDDILGAFGDPAITGKDADGDLREGKRTLLVAHAFEAASEPDRAFLAAHLGKEDLTGGEADRIREIFRSSGALRSTQVLIDAHRKLAVAALVAQPGISGDVAAALTELADLAAVRES